MDGYLLSGHVEQAEIHHGSIPANYFRSCCHGRQAVHPGLTRNGQHHRWSCWRPVDPLRKSWRPIHRSNGKTSINHWPTRHGGWRNGKYPFPFRCTREAFDRHGREAVSYLATLRERKLKAPKSGGISLFLSGLAAVMVPIVPILWYQTGAPANQLMVSGEKHYVIAHRLENTVRGKMSDQAVAILRY